MPRSLFISSFLAVLSAACSAAYAGKEHEPTPFGAKADNGIATSQDIRSTELVLDVSTLEGAATIEVVTASGTATFAVGDLSIAAVEGEGGPLPFTSSGQQLDVSLPKQRAESLKRFRFQRSVLAPVRLATAKFWSRTISSDCFHGLRRSLFRQKRAWPKRSEKQPAPLFIEHALAKKRLKSE